MQSDLLIPPKALKEKRICFEGIEMYQKDIDLIKKIRLTNYFDSGEKEYLELTIKRMNRVEKKSEVF